MAKKYLVFSLVILILIAGFLTFFNFFSDEHWNYKAGFVVAKENNKLLIVREKPTVNEVSINEILENAQPDAIWLTVDESDYKIVSVGDKVKMKIPSGAIDQSYPAQAAGDIKIK